MNLFSRYVNKFFTKPARWIDYQGASLKIFSCWKMYGKSQTDRRFAIGQSNILSWRKKKKKKTMIKRKKKQKAVVQNEPPAKSSGVAIAAFFNAVPAQLLRSNRFNLRPPLQMSRIRIPFRAVSLRDWKCGFHVGTHCCLIVRRRSSYPTAPLSQTHRAH